MPPTRLSAPEFAQARGVSRMQVSKWCAAGMPHARDGRRLVIDPVAAGAWIEANRRSLTSGGDHGGGRPRKDGTRPPGKTRVQRFVASPGAGRDGAADGLVGAGREVIASGGDVRTLDARFNSLDARDLLEKSQTELLIAETVEKVLKLRIERLKAEGALIDVADASRSYTRTVTAFGRHLRQMTRTCALRIAREAALDAEATRTAQRILEEELDLAVTKLSAGRLGGEEEKA